MDYPALDESLKKGIVAPVYVFYGSETYLRDRALEQFQALLPEQVRDFNLDVVDGRETGIEDIINLASTLPFMSEWRLVIVKNADFFKGREEKSNPVDDSLGRYLDNPPASTCLIFCTETVEKKHRIFKTIASQGQVVEFSPLKGRELNRWLDRRAGQLGKVLEPAAVAGLVTAVGNDLQQLSTELEKLTCYALTEKITAVEVAGLVSRTAEYSIFELVDAVGGKNYRKAVRMARELVFLGEPVIRLLFMIARQFRLLIRAKDLREQGLTAGQVAGQMQVHPYVAQKCIQQAGNFSLPELKTALEKILAADADIKNGRQEAMLALELLIIALCEKQPAAGR